MYIFLPLWLPVHSQHAINCQTEDTDKHASYLRICVTEPSTAQCSKHEFTHRCLPSAKAEQECYYHKAHYILCVLTLTFSMIAFSPYLDCVIKGMCTCIYEFIKIYKKYKMCLCCLSMQTQPR